MADLRVNIAGVEFKNPVITASGTFGFGQEYARIYDISRLGGISCKGTTLHERPGNPAPRIAETPSGILNSVGLQNPGVDAFIRDDLPFLKKQNTVVIANIAGSQVEDYVETVRRLQGTGVDMIELNISCPNVKEGGVSFGTSPKSVENITKQVKAVAEQPLMIKLTPNVTDITETAAAAEAGGADAVSLINTLTGMKIDINTCRPILKNNTGGMSGAAVFPVALRMVWQVANRVKIPVVGMGGITKWQDAVEMLLAGASAVQIGTANFTDAYTPLKVIAGINEYLDERGEKSVSDIVGKVQVW
ncbi:MAG: dihydroorotate dehydrogenase [Clostridia bacterium]|nr:dihydroorotate dehydrogenase [Clostridia bacterium]